jgi:16S rRNA (uracil1498-N3)-methyltransferase
MLRLYVGVQHSLQSSQVAQVAQVTQGVLAPQQELDLPAAAARHVQVRRLQPGDPVVLFDGAGQDWPSEVLAMGRREVRVRVGEPVAGLPELPWAVTLACGMPANERMDALVEKAAELGAAALQPLICERSVLRLAGERAERRREHWQAVSASASEQSGRAVVMQVQPVQSLQAWLAALTPYAAVAQPTSARVLLSTGLNCPPLSQLLPNSAGPNALASGPNAHTVGLLSGPEGGLSPAEEAAALACGFQRATLGPRVLRADTAPLAALAWLATR